MASSSEGSEAAKQWCQRLKDELWEGRGSIALELVQAERANVRSPSKRAFLAELETYLEHNLGRIDYPHYRELDLTVGSGEVEAQCKTLVVARCKQAGMCNWTYAGVEAVLRLRAAKQDGSFNAPLEAKSTPGGLKFRHRLAAAPFGKRLVANERTGFVPVTSTV